MLRIGDIFLESWRKPDSGLRRWAKAGIFVCVGLAGCTATDRPFNSFAALSISGRVSSGQQPISNAAVQLYAVGTTGDGSAATALLSSPLSTDASGKFQISQTSGCPSATAQLYVTASGGDPGLQSGTNNAQSMLMALAGTCGSPASFVVLNETTTIASVYAMAPFMTSFDHIGTGSGDAQNLAQAVSYANQLVNFSTGSAPGPALQQGQIAPLQKLSSLANILASCVNTAGGVTGDGSPCGTLFSDTSDGTPLTNTVDATLKIAQNPTRNVQALYLLGTSSSLFEPALTSVPTDWTLTIASSVPAPTFSLPPGTYAGPQSIVVSDSDPSAAIYYTTDGSTPSASSNPYTGAIALTLSSTLQAVAIAGGLSSALAIGVYTISSPVIAAVTVTPSSVTLGASQTQAFTATVAGSGGSGVAAGGPTTAVTWSLSPAVGTISAQGVYTAPATISTPQTVVVTATSTADPTKMASSTVLLSAGVATNATYYMSPLGRDSNSGTSSSSPWLTPNHAGLNCGDTIIAAAGGYPAITITTNPTCSGHGAVDLRCATFAACTINQNTPNEAGMLIQASNWEIFGWQVSVTGAAYTGCFGIQPAGNANLHDIYFINNVASGCQGGGFVASDNGKASVDYLAWVGDIAYNAAQGNAYCFSGFSILHPAMTDTQPGTHLYMAQDFAWHNLEPARCAGVNSTDGEGFILDTFSGTATIPPYTQQAVIEDVIAIYNGAYGIFEGGSGNSSAPVYIEHSTAYGNFINTNQNQSNCGQIASVGFPTSSAANINRYTQVSEDLAVPSGTTEPGCGSHPAYAYYFGNVDATDQVYNTAGYSSSSYNIGSTPNITGFTAGPNNVFGQNPGFPNPAEPAAPSCSGTASVIDCMAPLIANFTPTNPALAAFGYQPPSAAMVTDPLFPQWLCNVYLGPIPTGCATGSSTSSSTSLSAQKRSSH